MKNRFKVLTNRKTVVCLMASFLFMAFGSHTLQAQIKFNEANEIREANLGVERVARYYIPAYSSKAVSNNETKWVQIDLGSVRKIDGIKLLPGAQGWGPASGGFPARFKIEVSDDPAFVHSIMYEDYTIKDEYPIPDDVVASFATKEVNGRYVRFTATQLRDNKLVMTKIMVMSDGKDIAEGCKVTESNSSKDSNVELITRQARPQGEFDITDNPGNVMPEKTWKPVSYKAEAPLCGVKLSDGLFKTTMDNNINYLLNSFTFDQLVRNFRVKAGLPVEPFDGNLSVFWFKQLPGSEAGRFLMGAGNTLRWTENDALRKEMNDIIDVIDQCKEPDGYLMAYPKHCIFDVEYGAYTRSWVTHGLIEAGFAGNQKAFSLLRGFYDWFDKCAFLPEMLRRPRQGTQGIIPMTRTYFTPVGKPKDIQVVQRYFQENYWMEQLANRDPKAIWQYPYDRPHNYLVTGIEPYLDLYRATGAKKYLDAALGAWDLYHDNWEIVGGSLAINEGPFLYAPKSYYLRREAGELCGNAFWIRLNQRFHLLYPEEEKYVSEIEKSLYNVVIANQYGSEGIRYFAKLVDRKYGPHVPNTYHCMNTCCEGQGTRIYGSLPEYIYSVAKDGVYVDLYSASEISYKTNNHAIRLKMSTQFPYDSKVDISVSSEQPAQSKIYIRVPSWAAGDMAVMVNGSEVGKGKPGSYLLIDRKWGNNDMISFTLPMSFRVTKYNGIEKGFEEGHYAIEYGPILMAMVGVKGKKINMEINASAESIKSMLKPIVGKPLHFAIEGDSEFEYWPYFEVQDQPFSCFPGFTVR
ncbi:MAG: glycoside hydrolase family 127 protein [Parabacteroides sp.]|nr:glycoside hydrolase family 127 protein [Parabacteroides sp.]